MDDATSSASAPITGATAAIAEFPQIALPVATRMARRRSKSEPPRDQHAEDEAQRDDRHDRHAERGTRAHEQREIHRDSEDRHRELEHLFPGEADARLEARARPPDRAHDHANEQCDDERLDDRRTEEPRFDARDGDGRQRDGRGDESSRD